MMVSNDVALDRKHALLIVCRYCNSRTNSCKKKCCKVSARTVRWKIDGKMKGGVKENKRFLVVAIGNDRFD